MSRPNNAPSNLSGRGDLRPYLSPEHWQGHTLGVGETVKRPKPPTAAIPELLKLKTVNSMHLDIGETQALRTYPADDTFSAGDFDPGAFTFYHKEVLEGKEPVTGEEIKEYASLEPRRITADAIIAAAAGEAPDEALELHSYIQDGGRSYVSTIYFGMVETFGRSEKKVFLGFPVLGLLKRSEGTKLWAKTAYEVEPDVINVGDVTHFRGRRGRESIQRVNVLEVHGYGEHRGHIERSPLLQQVEVFRGSNPLADTA